MNRPDRRNAFNSLMLDEFISTREDVASDDKVKVIIITGGRIAFCSGFDFSGGSALDAGGPVTLKMRQLLMS